MMSKQGVRPLSVVVGYHGTDETSHNKAPPAEGGEPTHMETHNASCSAL